MSLSALVVDDSPAMRKLIRFALSKIGEVVVCEAADGAKGLKMLNSGKFDIILTDINMPVMDGLKLVSLVRSDEVHRDTPIVVITTEAAVTDRKRALDLGASAYLTKPIQAPQVVSCVCELLNLSAQGKPK